MTVTSKRFIDQIKSLSDNQSIIENHINSVKLCLMDYLAAFIGGTKLSNNKIVKLLETYGEEGHYSIIGQSKKTSRDCALLCNGYISHVAELDDGVIAGIIHPGAPIFSSLLTISQDKKIDWINFVKGVIIGYETSCRLAEAIQPSHKKLGYHASATCGTVGVTMGILSMLNAPLEIMQEGFSLGLASSHGTLKVLEDASELKPYNISTAALNGTISATMALAGFKGANDPLGGEAGFFAQMATKVNEDKLFKDSNSLSIDKTYFKPYASCRYTHPALEAGINLRKENRFNVTDIKSIDIKTYSLAIKHHDHTEVPNISSAKMCIPFCAAIGLIKGDGGINSFTTQTVSNQEIKDLMKKVSVNEDFEFTNAFPEKSIASMTVTLNSGVSFQTLIDMPKGEPGNPMKEEDIIDKLRSSCSFAEFDFKNVLELIQNVESGIFPIGRMIPELNQLYKI